MSSRRSHASRRVILLPVASALALVLAACSGGATVGPAETSSTVDVTLQEWAVVPAQASVKAGSITFAVTNAGPEDKHDFVIFRTDLGARGMPVVRTMPLTRRGARGAGSIRRALRALRAPRAPRAAPAAP